MRVLGPTPTVAPKNATPAPDTRDLLTKAGDFVSKHNLPGAKIGEALGTNLYGLSRLFHGDLHGFTQAADEVGTQFEPIVGDTIRSMALPASLAVSGGGGAVRAAAKFGATSAIQGAGESMARDNSAVQVAKDAAQSGTFGAMAGAGSSVLGSVSRYVSNNLPTRILRDLTKQSKIELRAGKDVAPTMLADRRVGTMEGLIRDAHSNIEQLGNQIKAKLAQGTAAGTTVQRDDIFHSVAQSFNADGAALDKGKVSEIISTLAPQAQGLLAKQTLTLSEANQLRSSIDKTLGDKAFLKSQVPFAKDVLKEFSNHLRETVKEKGPKELRPLFSEQSKEIRLRDVLNDASIADSRKNIVSWRDIISAGVGGSMGGLPGVAAAIALERSLTSAPFLTGAAVGIDQTSKIMRPILAKLAPAERLLITSLIARASAGGKQQTANQPQQRSTTRKLQ